MLRTFTGCGVVWLLAVSVSLAQFGSGGLGGAPAAKTSRSDSKERIKKIEAALQDETALELIDTPLQDVVEFIAEKHSLPIQLDMRSLEEYGLSGDEPVTLSVKGVRLSNALDLMLRPLDLTWTIDRGYLQITTIETAEYTLFTEIYDVRSLVAPTDADGAVVYSTDAPTGGYDQLISLITRTVHPDTWEELGGVGTIATFSAGDKRLIVVSQSFSVQREIRDLLTELETHVADTGEKLEAKTAATTRVYPLAGEGDKSAEEVAALVKAAISPESWNGEHKVEGLAGALVVKNSSNVHGRVKKMLMALDVLKSDPVLNQGDLGFGYGAGGEGFEGGGFSSGAGFQ